MRFAPEISGGFGCVSAARLGLVKLRDAVPDNALTGHPGALSSRTGGLFLLGTRAGDEMGSADCSTELLLLHRLTGPDDSLSSTWPSLDWDAHWIQYIKLCWRQSPAAPAPVASWLLHVDKER